jgi:glycosyltransferase involved in cell wall biosynthesis
VNHPDGSTPEQVAALLSRGRARARAGDRHAALDCFRAAYEAAPFDRRAVLALGETCVQLGGAPAAGSVYAAYLEAVPGDAEVRARLDALEGRAPRTEPAAPGRRPRILFVAYAQSTHTHAWVDLLQGAPYDVQVFGIEASVPPASFSWPVVTWAQHLGPRPYDPALEGRLLAAHLRDWRPDVVHTLGIEPASLIYQRARRDHGLAGLGTWVATCRGGSDIFLRRFQPDHARALAAILAECDLFVADNRMSYQYARDLGLAEAKVSPTGPVPGTGGIDLAPFRGAAAVPPSRRERIVLWPKAYESRWSKALPVLEALALAWERIRPCTIVMTAMEQGEAEEWLPLLPEELRRSCQLRPRIPRAELLDLMARTRVLLAPSLVDGVPNSLYEAMAAGAVPIVSPLDSIRSAIGPDDALFARNLYPQEIADALVTALADDARCDALAARNVGLVERIAGREGVRKRVTGLYARLTAALRPGAST